MLTYAVKRVGIVAVILVVVMLAMYSMVFLVPSDPASVAFGPRATPALKAGVVERIGLNQPIIRQIWRFLCNAATSNPGYDVWSNRPVIDLIQAAFPSTLFLGAVAMGWALGSCIALGCLAVAMRDSWADRLLGILSVSFISVPSSVIAICSLLIFSVWLGWLPAIGAGHRVDNASQIKAVILPAFAIGITSVGYLARMVRASVLEVMEAPHIRTARAFSLPEGQIVLNYALRIAFVATIAIVAVGFGSILSSAIFVEAVFSRPGIGPLMTTAGAKRNFPVVMGTVLFMTAFDLMAVTLADMLIARLDPRLRDVFRG